jgi:monomeric isocitrate dehydrogenase
MEAYQAVLVAVVALLVGALLPVLFQLVLTLRAVRSVAEQAGPVVASVAVTAERLQRITEKLEADGRVDGALAAIDSLTRTVAKLQETARLASTVGAAVVPALAAAVQAWQSNGDGDGAAGEPAPAPAPASVREAS